MAHAPQASARELDTTTGALDTTFTQATGANDWVRALAVSGSALYVGGDFTTYRGSNAFYTMAVDVTTGALK